MKSFALLLSAAVAQKVQVALYYESLCPYCQDTITGSFANAFATPGFLDMADVLLVPYGNAHEAASGDSWTFTCQHGVDECAYNQIESCSNFYIADPITAFNFINCVESNDSKRKSTYESVLATCSATVSADEFAGIQSCWTSQQGIDLEHANALLTDALVPSHQYVPWLVGQGVHTDDIQSQIESDLLGYVCANYTGANRAAACDQATPVKSTSNAEYCYPTATQFLQ